MSGVTAELEVHEEDGGHQQEPVSPTPEGLPELIARLAQHWSASLWLRREGQELVLSGSNGRLAVLAKTGEDDFYDLCGDRSAQGWIEFAHGGQLAEHPRRHVVSAEAAIKVAQAFLQSHLEPAIDPMWERQEGLPKPKL